MIMEKVMVPDGEVIALRSQKQITVDGVVVESQETIYKLKATVELVNVKQVGSTIQGQLKLVVDFGFISIEVWKQFSFSTLLANPIAVELGVISVPIVGDIPVVGLFYYDLIAKKACVELTLLGYVTLARKCATW